MTTQGDDVRFCRSRIRISQPPEPQDGGETPRDQGTVIHALWRNPGVDPASRANERCPDPPRSGEAEERPPARDLHKVVVEVTV